ncbi:hypothetical protein BZU93_25290 [Salmonella enterica subsp. enterica]|nr:hypothetical protein [Salmonella enterica subsp. enterica serovar Enteritidis]
MDKELADRIRREIGDDPNIGELRMFGGLCFMLNGNMLVCTTRDNGLLARIGEAALADAVAQPGVAAMVMGGRTMKDYAHVAADHLGDAALRIWIARATDFVGPMPQKTKKAAKALR